MRKALITSVMLTCLLLVSSVKGQEKERVEKDLLGEKRIPAEAYYGVQTERSRPGPPIVSPAKRSPSNVVSISTQRSRLWP
jgi:hypothetical protein